MKLSIRTKILLAVLLLLLASLLTSLSLSVRLFNEDKRAYVFESQAALVAAMKSQIEAEWQAKIQWFNFVSANYFERGDAYFQGPNLKALVTQDEDVVYFRAKMTKGGKTSLLLEQTLAEKLNVLSSNSPEKQQWLADFKTKLGGIGDGAPDLFIFAAVPGQALIGVHAVFVADNDPNHRLYLSAMLAPRKQYDAFAQSAGFYPALLLSSGDMLIPPRVSDGDGFAPNPKIYESIRDEIQSIGAGEYVDKEQGKIIYAFAKVLDERLLLAMQVPSATAFRASAKLIEKNVYATIVILALGSMFGLFFSSRITAALGQLYQATLAYSRGDFTKSIVVKTKDEIGALANSFQIMAGEIVRLLALSAEKARMDRELETAQLVQKNFFPADDVTLSRGELSGYYSPASECGGDWWGYLESKDRLHLCIGDATGHGVPAALITSTVKSAFETLANVNADLSPTSILGALNKAVYSSGAREVKMSFFVAMVDLKSGLIQYANAAHNFPILCQQGSGLEKKSKDGLVVLKKRPDPHLGDDPHHTYQLHTEQMQPGDALFLYTDGLIECQNPSGEMYGKKRLLRLLMDAASNTAATTKQKIAKEAFDFFGHQTQADDVTYVLFKWHGNDGTALQPID
jgi:sigma-B regulation protein RsbU (phosphoserine phosphatase)